ncbi:hypothetical protein O9X80_07570 [Agrobacterium salinitolerans]|uniref:hypothetical protein n=1 Tax=Agrobacterium salinitolerans TaxID=1183413 RepID=UPI0022B819B1|nr:hypothetical protein [Agrobacterium salinitolerans]MCZ7974346.1 hypothetical protein [Agrobacterium salinitolerans]
MKYEEYDCLDIGADVNSMNWCKEYLGALNPIGLNIEHLRLDNMRRAGLPCEEINAFDIPDTESVDYIFMSHLLEHLQTAQEVTDLVLKCLRLAKKGIYIAGPFFEDDSYIRTHGLKFVWGDWSGHVSRFGIYNFLPLLRHMMGEKVTVSLGFPIFDSSSDNVVSVAERKDIDSFERDAKAPKPSISLPRPAFQEFVAFIKLDDQIDANRIHEARHGNLGRASWELWEKAETGALQSIHGRR